jgi:hypothetical protein
MIILPGMNDKRLRGNGGRWKGEVWLFNPKGEVIAYVYGKTLDQMRRRKHLIYKMLKEEEDE